MTKKSRQFFSGKK